MRPLLKWIVLFTLLFPSCDVLEPHIVEVPVIWELRDTLYVQQIDTLYLTNSSSFSMANYAELFMATSDSIACEYGYALTKLDTIVLDSLWLTGYLIDWNRSKEMLGILDSTRRNIWPDNARHWNQRGTYGDGMFYANNKWHLNDWTKSTIIKYSMSLEYK